MILTLGRMKNISNARTAVTRLIAQRTCVACRQVKDKRKLIRLVLTSEGDVQIDVTGKMSGRGAYLCPVAECWEAVFKGNKLEHSLHIGITPENRQRLIEQGNELRKGVES